MCTAITYKTMDHYFGRNLDLEYTYHETVVITPRRYPFSFRYTGKTKENYAMIGMATVADNYPLYYEATNQCNTINTCDFAPKETTQNHVEL